MSQPSVEGPKRRPLLIGAALVATVAVVIAAIALSGSGDGGGESASGDTTATETTPKEPTTEKKRPKPAPDRLNTSQLIKQGDAVCVISRSAYGQARKDFPAAKSEEVPDVAYSERLVQNSSRMVDEFQALVPPKSKADEYGAYLESQEEVAQWDRDALAAARAGDVSAYLEARNNRDDSEDNRTRMAEAIGFEICSGSQL